MICTALSLFKVIIHTSIGAGIRSFSAKKESDVQEEEDDTWSKVWTIGGISLCVALFIYISVVARRAVDDELDDEIPGSVSEERVAFLDAEDDDVGSRALRLPLTLQPQSNMSEAQLVSPHRVVSGLPAA